MLFADVSFSRRDEDGVRQIENQRYLCKSHLPIV